MQTMKMKRVLSLLLVLLVASLALEAKTFLVSVGVNDYSAYPYKGKETNMNLRLPTADATTISEIFSINKAKSSIDYVLMLDSKATKANIVKAMRKLFKNAQEDDIVVFFFSGHGFPGGFCVYDNVIFYDEIRDAMSHSKSKNKMIFADACHSGALRGNKRVEHAENSDSTARKANVMLLLSSRSNEVSNEIGTMENGIFTEFLKKGLRGNADVNRDRVITAKELFMFVHDGVSKMTANSQHPVMWGNFDDNMPVMKW